jgi:hypothetical protein
MQLAGASGLEGVWYVQCEVMLNSLQEDFMSDRLGKIRLARTLSIY